MEHDLVDRFADLECSIGTYGYGVEHVEARDAEPAYGHTVGLTADRLPELAVTGVDRDLTTLLLGLARRRILALDATPRPGPLEPSGVLPLWLLPIAHAPRRLSAAVQFYGPKVTGFQAVYADSAGRFPWDAGYDHHRQPLLGRAPDGR